MHAMASRHSTSLSNAMMPVVSISGRAGGLFDGMVTGELPSALVLMKEIPDLNRTHFLEQILFELFGVAACRLSAASSDPSGSGYL